MEIGNKIKKLRNNNNMTTQELADAIGITRSQISKIETGASMPSIEVLQSVCNTFGVTLSEFFNDGTNLDMFTPEVKELIDNVMNLPPEGRKFLNAFIKTLVEGGKPKMRTATVNGKERIYMYDADITPNGFTPEEEKYYIGLHDEREELLKKIAEIEKRLEQNKE